MDVMDLRRRRKSKAEGGFQSMKGTTSSEALFFFSLLLSFHTFVRGPRPEQSGSRQNFPWISSLAACSLASDRLRVVVFGEGDFCSPRCVRMRAKDEC